MILYSKDTRPWNSQTYHDEKVGDLTTHHVLSKRHLQVTSFLIPIYYVLLLFIQSFITERRPGKRELHYYKVDLVRNCVSYIDLIYRIFKQHLTFHMYIHKKTGIRLWVNSYIHENSAVGSVSPDLYRGLFDLNSGTKIKKNLHKSTCSVDRKDSKLKE